MPGVSVSSPAWPVASPRPFPQVIAHRGASYDEPEHTLSAYRRAIEAGADALECDVRLTADGHLVCVHDRTVHRTSNGRGVVSTLELAELEGLDWGSWMSRPATAGDTDVPDRDRNQLLTLRRLLASVADAGRRVEVAIETKHPTRYAGQVERRLAEVLQHFGWTRLYRGEPPPARVMSYSLLALQRMRSRVPAVPRVLLFDRIPLRYRDGSLPRGVHIAGIDVGVLRAHPAYVERLHLSGNAAHVHTVDEPDDVQRCLDAGVDGIITNRPADVLTALGRGPGASG